MRKGGELTGKYHLNAPLPAQTRRARQGMDTSAPDWRRRMEAVEALRPLAAADLTLGQFAPLWAMQQLEENLKVADGQLPAELAERATELTQPWA